ncbi:helix-turn-helix domain-containing protein [Streptomyces sp. NPDC057099]|uniref:helix-turn-helix domain-containing protein n=1 Tax=Streptomyces sp. NPDC057099 TaxID=3346019 RepID=UPI003641294A
MNKNGQDGEVTDLPFRAVAGAPPGAQVLALSALLDRARGHDRDAYAPMRPSFHHLISVRSGRLDCSVDFGEHTLDAGAWLWVRPGQILQFRSDLAAAGGTVVLFPSGVLDPATAKAAGVDRPALRTAPLYPRDDAPRRTLDLLVDEYGRLADLPLETHMEVVRHLLSVLLLRLAHERGGPGDDERGSEPFLRFQQAVERDFARSHRVEDYAARLGYSVRTLTRASRADAGCGAKHFIDERVLLEARRLLVHTDLATSAVGERLGFPQATAFTRFFRTRTGETPAAFRARYRNAP